MKLITIFFSMSFVTSLLATTCQDIPSCVENISKLTNKKYIFEEKLKGTINTTSNFEISIENADNFLTEALYLNGYSRVPTQEKDTFLIIPSRDIRYQSLPTYYASYKDTPNIPKNFDYSHLVYTFSNYEHGQVRATANNLRPFLSRYARTIESKNLHTLSVYELNSHINKIIEIAKLNDRALKPNEIKIFLEDEKERKKREKEDRLVEIKNKNKDENDKKENK